MAVKVYVVYYSMHGHVETLAKEILKGVNSVAGVEGKLWQVPETLPAEELARLRAAPKSDVPIITPLEFMRADGFLLGFPARSGTMASQLTAFLETTVEPIAKECFLAGKPAGIFYSSHSQGDGQEAAALSAVTQLVPHGMIFVPIGHTLGADKCENEMEEMKVGIPYGTGTDAGSDGSKQPTKLELDSAFHQGKLTATIAKQLKEYGIPERVLMNYW